MGGSSYSDDLYKDRVADRVTRGVSTFSHDDDIRKGKAAPAAHANLSPNGVVRESRDSATHPNSNAIGICFDVTGSMGCIPVQLQKRLPDLMSLLIRKGYIEDPQILFSAVGDHRADRVPLQVGQFESGIEMDDDLTKIFLEGGGGGSFEESYELPLYFFGKKTQIDCFEKRGKKGYLFIVGDEKPYPFLRKDVSATIFGEAHPQGDLSIQEVVDLARLRYHVFFVIPMGAHNSRGPNMAILKSTWTELLGAQNVLILEDPEKVCEVIGHAIGLMEGSADVASFAHDATVSSALAPLAKSTALAHVGTAELAESSSRPDTNVRL